MKNIDKVNIVFQTVFDDGELAVFPGMSAKDVVGWDSFNHINLIVALEEAFELSFTADEIDNMTCVGDLVSILQARDVDISF
ncbi:MAG: acyl carrier protein [Rhodospirillales bacterium]|nr:acyl carrier protein [Rhodospirillales bacterium]